MKKRTILTLAVAAVLFAPTVFFTCVAYQRNAVSSDTGEIDTMATDYLWTPNGVRAVGLGEPDTMATEFLWVPKQVS